MADGCRMDFLSEVFHLQETCQLSLFATSRHIPDIEEMFDNSMRLEIRASDTDVERYLDGRMSQLPGYVRNSKDLQNEIKSKIIKAIDGMYVTHPNPDEYRLPKYFQGFCLLDLTLIH